jgi:hypothetical protein
MRHRNPEDKAMVWSTSHIFWQEQLMILSILLPPIFISATLLGLSAPRLFAAKRTAKREARKEPLSPSHAMPHSR